MATDNTTPTGMTPAGRRAAALAQARELERELLQLAELPEFGEGSPIDDALTAIDAVVGALEPDDADDERPKPRLHLVGR